MNFDGASFTVCRIDPAQEEVRLFLYDDEGQPHASFRSVNGALRGEGKQLGVAMNAGMYHPNRAPVGLYLEDGTQEMRLVTNAGPGNFGLLPNGVLCLSSGRAEVIESLTYERRQPGCTYATQSGPMLVIDGALHPRFLPKSDSVYERNGAAVAADGTLFFAISNDKVNFHHFGRLFRDVLKTPNALYLDGNISRLYDAGSGRHDAGWPMGPIIGTVEKAE
ncbi:hypothetical protein FEV53_05855 [Palleronia caenipelagi]|uniref:Phosphodiester glycosidase domain-containing protein n=2 Tax=Palleronia caenipelagi TaxID=2489174 RepID=A0A547Q7F6_9RHOB|nr:phosphodiester glycosidase family protein [Palleronia caenipelagi]TRD22312.1 hypothetical protein FEV53_05855 [Palleronia caenipelagi]